MKTMSNVHNHHITIRYAKRYCKEDISLIENYAAMLADTSQCWCCHHRREISEHKSYKQLIAEKLYYARPAAELIFLTKSEHTALHNKDAKTAVPRSEETKQKIRETLTGVPLSEERKRNISEAMNRQDVKDKCAKGGAKGGKKSKGKHWFNNGVKNVYCKECPEGYEPGMLKSE